MLKAQALAVLFVTVLTAPVYGHDMQRFAADVHHIERYLDELDYLDAIDCANEGLKTYGEDWPIFHFLKAQALQQLGRFKDAVGEYTKAIDYANAKKKMQARMVEMLRARAICNLSLKKTDKAVEDLTFAAHINPRLGLTQLELAMANKQANNYQAVVDNTTDALKAGIDIAMSFRAYNARAWAYDHLNKPDLAKADREKIKALQKKFIE